MFFKAALNKIGGDNFIKWNLLFTHLSFGENQIQEVENKWVTLRKDFPRIKLHFIGAIQSKKVKSIFQHCD